ncbi:MAG: LacI family DNA-binding transcriptional regulator [Lachnospirales bacterium]
MPITINEIAEKCGVSPTTVLRAINGGSIKKETKELILKTAEKYNYRPNLIARSLNNGKTMTIGVVTINIDNMYFVQSLNEINMEADKHGYFVNIVVCDDDVESEKKLIQGLTDRRVDGILISPINKGVEFEKYLKSLKIPIVCLGNVVSENYTTVQINEMNASIKAVELIVSKGYNRIVFVCPPLSSINDHNIYTHEQRYKGFLQCAEKNPKVQINIIDKKNYVSDVKKILSKYKNDKIAFLCSGDVYALNVMHFAKEENLTVPDDFGLMGFDNIDVLKYITPKLTTVSTNLKAVSVTAVNELLQQINNEDYLPKSIFLNFEILDRETL